MIETLIRHALEIALRDEFQEKKVVERIVEPAKIPKEKTVILHHKIRITKPTILAKEEGNGKISEITIIAQNKNTKIRVNVDDKDIIDHTLEELTKISKYINTINAEFYNDTYFFSISNIKYLKNFEITILSNNDNIEYFINYDKVVIT